MNTPTGISAAGRRTGRCQRVLLCALLAAGLARDILALPNPPISGATVIGLHSASAVPARATRTERILASASPPPRGTAGRAELQLGLRPAAYRGAAFAAFQQGHGGTRGA